MASFGLLSWLDDLLGNIIALNGTQVLPQRKVINFVGPAVTAVDNPGLGTTDITWASQPAAGSALTGVQSLSALNDNGKTITNTGALTLTLPTAALGLYFRIVVDNTAGISLRPASTDVIQFHGLVSSNGSGGGQMAATEQGASVLLAGITGKWYSIGAVAGDWTAT